MQPGLRIHKPLDMLQRRQRGVLPADHHGKKNLGLLFQNYLVQLRLSAEIIGDERAVGTCQLRDALNGNSIVAVFGE